VLLTVMVGTMASIMSSTIVNVAVPAISAHFSLGQERAQWVSAAFMVSMTLAMALTPWLLQRYGLRRTYVGAALLLMALSLALVGGVSAATPYVLLVSWIVVGRVGLGLVLPALSLGAVRSLPPPDYPQAASVISFVRQLGGAIGVSLVGVLLEWRLALEPAGAAFEHTLMAFAVISATAAAAAWRMGSARGRK
jgi:MFS transporter, DHA2 family, multidrug resistance protein